MYLEVWEICTRCGGTGEHSGKVKIQRDNSCLCCVQTPRFLGHVIHPGYVRRFIPLAEAVAAVGS